MNRKLFNVFLVTSGAAIGSAVTWFVVKTKYEQILQEEIDSVKEEYRILTHKVNNEKSENDSDDVSSNEDLVEVDEDYSDRNNFEPDQQSLFSDYCNISSAYRSHADEDEQNDNDEEGGTGYSDNAEYVNGPYVISPDDFRCSPPGYNAQALDYYADGVLADGWGVKMNIEETIGEDSLKHFGEYVDDIVYVRNERKEIDYEVSRDPRNYRDVNR